MVKATPIQQTAGVLTEKKNTVALDKCLDEAEKDYKEKKERLNTCIALSRGREGSPCNDTALLTLENKRSQTRSECFMRY